MIHTEERVMNDQFTNQLIDLSLYLLPKSITTDHLFCDRLLLKNSKLTKSGQSRRYSLIALIGLYHAASRGYEVKLNLDKVKKCLLKELDKFSDPDLGLLLQLSAVTVEKPLANQIFKQILSRKMHKKVEKIMTINAAWLLTGIAKAFPLISDEKTATTLMKRLKDKCFHAFHNGLFCTNNGFMKNLLAQKVYTTIGSFADQIYPIIGLSEYLKLFFSKEVETILKRAIDKLISLQGDLGEWSWLYQVKESRILEKYPVYSVHQDAMAPMALRVAGNALKENYSGIIQRSLKWFDHMAMGDDNIINQHHHLIWRSLQKRGKKKSIYDYLGLNYGGLPHEVKQILFKQIIFNQKPTDQNPALAKLKVDYETRPYHYGWILYALI